MDDRGERRESHMNALCESNLAIVKKRKRGRPPKNTVKSLKITENQMVLYEEGTSRGLKRGKSNDMFSEEDALKCLEKFTIIVNGEIINHELSQDSLTEYFQLCYSQKSFLHDEIKSLCSRFVIGAIEETVKVADAIRSFELSSSEDKFNSLNNNLKVLEYMGMKVSFLRRRLCQIEDVLVSSKRYQEARLARKDAEEKKQCLEVSLFEVKNLINELDDDINTMEVTSVIKEIASAPW